MALLFVLVTGSVNSMIIPCFPTFIVNQGRCEDKPQVRRNIDKLNVLGVKAEELTEWENNMRQRTSECL